MPVEVSIHSDESRVDVRRRVVARDALFALLMASSAAAFWAPLRSLVTLCMGSEEYSYILLIPVMVLGLFYLEHGTVFKHLDYSVGAGTLVILGGISVAGAGAVLSSQFSANSRLSLEMLGLVIIWIGSFVLCYGMGAARAGLFALLFSLLLVPLPEVVMAQPIALIQHASADVTGLLFLLGGVPVFRDGLTFSLPRLSFVVATECSGIHSSIALFIASILVGHFYFKPGWKRPLLVLLVFPIISFTNGFRMFALATLAVYVNMSFFHGNLHHRGGSLFFVLALVILAVVTKLLRGRWRLRSAASPAKVEAVA
jgi:exosortase